MDRISYTLLENTFPDEIAKLKEHALLTGLLLVSTGNCH